MTDYKYPYIYALIWLSFVPFFISICALLCRYNCFIHDFWAEPSWVYLSNSSPSWLFFFSHSRFFSLTLSFSPTSVTFKYSSNGVTTLLFTSRPASDLFLARTCHITLSFSNFPINFLFSFLHLQHPLYKCLTDCTSSLYHQH